MCSSVVRTVKAWRSVHGHCRCASRRPPPAAPSAASTANTRPPSAPSRCKRPLTSASSLRTAMPMLSPGLYAMPLPAMRSAMCTTRLPAAGAVRYLCYSNMGSLLLHSNAHTVHRQPAPKRGLRCCTCRPRRDERVRRTWAPPRVRADPPRGRSAVPGEAALPAARHWLLHGHWHRWRQHQMPSPRAARPRALPPMRRPPPPAPRPRRPRRIRKRPSRRARRGAS